MRTTTPLTLASLCAGALWGGCAWFLGAKAVGTPIWGGVVASPLIGWMVTALTHAGFCDRGGFGRTMWALGSVYLGALAFGLACGIAALVARGVYIDAEVLLEPVLGVLWGVTMTGFLLFLAPLAYFTHWVLEQQSA